MKTRKAEKDDIPVLCDIWERSVRATHDFLTEDDIRYYAPLVRDSYLPQLEVWVATDEENRPVGFIGLSDNKVEMLFVDAGRRGQGIGRRLLDHARALKGKLAVDVNEQNEAGHGFYKAYGFVRTGRSELDGQGRPFPLIHMEQVT